MVRATSVVVVALIAACGSGKQGGGAEPDKVAEPAPSEPAKVAEPAPSEPAPPPPEPPPVASEFEYPPPGPGPHEGFDLAALHARLQGVWLVRGWIEIPDALVVEGDKLDRRDNSVPGRSVSTFQLLSPCSYAGTTWRGSAKYTGRFVFDGDTLYVTELRGGAGLVQGDRTIACVKDAVYVFEGGACTRWRRRAAGWKQERATCGYTDDGAKFRIEDRSSKTERGEDWVLSVHGSVLRGWQMDLFKAEKVADLATAQARRAQARARARELSKVPAELPFRAWRIPAPTPAPRFEVNTLAWAAAVTRGGHWEFRVFRVKSADDDVVWLQGHEEDAFAPPAFVRISGVTKDTARGAPALLGLEDRISYGRFVRLDGKRPVVRFLAANGVEERTAYTDTLVVLAPKAWEIGAPIAYKRGAAWLAGRLAYATDAEAYVVTGDKLDKLAKADVRVIDVARRWEPGQRVWAARPGGAPSAFVEGTIAAVHADGLYYTIEAAGGAFDQDFAGVTEAP